ncbi:TAXI family TRAP transporter solute-binding subunit [Schlesneria paludicola]|uniref:hypothetical protein n=1 Tax=Schlesneria paludicola TaxID=360056 RepID=UPI00029A1FCE|nr:hypothetical protein [Schlesneria paludicola]
MNPLRLRIDPVIRNAEDVRSRVEREIPHHTGLMSLAGGVAAAASEAKHVAERLRRPFGIHRLPALFLVVALLMLVAWIYVHFFRTYTLTIALPDRDAHELNERSKRVDRLELKPVFVAGSPEAAKLVEQGAVDLAFVQGGIEIQSGLPRLETPDPEVVLWFVRPRATDLQSVRRVLTSVEGAGSHSVAQQFMKAWKIDKQVRYLHDWVELTGNEKYVIPEDVDAVFAVKDLADEKTLHASDRLAEAGFRLAAPDLGARLAHLDYLKPTIIPAGYLRSAPPYPTEATSTYSVATYLVAKRALTARMLAAASHLLDGQPLSITDGRYEPTLGETSEFVQGVDAFLGIIINLVLAFLALTGLEMLAYRKRFHELNSLVSLISIHQSSKDVLGVKDETLRHDHLLYLSLCSDLLGLVSMIGGYYTQENSSLLFSGMPEIIHQRCDGLKINIQLKILHATIKTEPVDPMSVPSNPPITPVKVV